MSGQTGYITIRSLLPQLKLRLADPDIESMLPDLAEMVKLNLNDIGYSADNSPVKFVNLEVEGWKAKVPADVFQIADIRNNWCFPTHQNSLDFGTLTGGNVPDVWQQAINTGYGNGNNGYWGSSYYKSLLLDYSLEGCWLKSPVKCEHITLIYLSIPVDSEDIPMIKVGHEAAFMAYVTMIRQQTRYMTKEIQYYEKEKDIQEYERQCLYARAKDANPSRRRTSAAAQIGNDGFKQFRNFNNRGGRTRNF